MEVCALLSALLVPIVLLNKSTKHQWHQTESNPSLLHLYMLRYRSPVVTGTWLHSSDTVHLGRGRCELASTAIISLPSRGKLIFLKLKWSLLVSWTGCNGSPNEASVYRTHTRANSGAQMKTHTRPLPGRPTVRQTVTHKSIPIPNMRDGAGWLSSCLINSHHWPCPLGHHWNHKCKTQIQQTAHFCTSFNVQLL